MQDALSLLVMRVAVVVAVVARAAREQEGLEQEGLEIEPSDIAERTDASSHALLKEKPKVEPPPLYKVMLLNDDYTPMEFVVGILQALFHRSHQEAMTIMMHVHKKGVGICGRYPYDIAETKAAQVVGVARKNEHPLQCVIEKDEGGIYPQNEC